MHTKSVIKPTFALDGSAESNKHAIIRFAAS
jgi:hypothetical protein